MWFWKVAFFVVLILFLLPSNHQEKMEVYGTAYRSMTDLERFCYRNPEICEKTSSIVETVRAKFRTTTELLEEVLHNAGFGAAPDSDENASPDERAQREGRTDSLPGSGPASAPAREVSQNTLTSDDLMPGWNGPGRVAYQSRLR